MTPKILIVDDEKAARNNIKILLQEIFGFTPTFEASNVLEGIKIIKNQQPDIVFLDISMPEYDGFELLNTLPKPHQFLCIMVTANPEYTNKALKAHVFDYITKPIDYKQFKKTIQDALIYLEKNFLKAKAPIEQEEKEESICFKSKYEKYFIKPSEVLLCEAAGNYANLYLGNNKVITVTYKVKDVHQLFGIKNFYRIHRSFLINISRVNKVVTIDKTNYVLLNGHGKKIPISQSKYRKFMDFMGKTSTNNLESEE